MFFDENNLINTMCMQKQGLSVYQSKLLAAWKLDESSGSRADSGPAALSLTDNNTVSYGGSIASNSRYCNGSSQYFTIPNASAYQMSSASYTIMAWFNKDAASGTSGTLVAKRTANGAGDWEYVLYAHTGGKMQFLVSDNAGNGTTSTGTTSYGAKTWNCAFATYNSAAATIATSLNAGSDEGSASTTGKTPTTNSANVSFGAVKNAAGETYTNFYGGKIGAIAAFNAVLTAGEKAELYNGGYQLNYSELSASLAAKVLWWVPFNQTSGNETDSKTGSTATALNTPTYRCGIYRTAQDRGSARYVAANLEHLSRTGGTCTGIDSYSGNFSIETAVRFDSAVIGATASCTLFGKGATSNPQKGVWLQKTTTDRPQITLGDGTTRISVNPTNVFSAGVLYHIVCTVNRSGNMIVYINGSVGTGTASASVAAIPGDLGTINLTIGGLSGSTYLEGEIGFMRFYNEALSSGDVTYLYNSGSLRSYENL